MAGSGITGKCVTVTFTNMADTQAFIGRVVSVGEIALMAESIEDNDVCTDVAKYLPGDIIDHDEVVIPCVFDPEAVLPSPGAKGSVVIEWPAREPSQNDGATISGGCHLTRVNIGESVAGQRIEAGIAFRWSGWNVGADADGPVFAPEALTEIGP